MSSIPHESNYFWRHNGKLLIINGTSDPDFSFDNIARWWKEIDKLNHGRATDFVRLFVPGMDHLTGGPATDRYEAFGALTDWVEKNAGPDRIEVMAPRITRWPGRTRPLCPYPQQSRYKGRGSVEGSYNFGLSITMTALDPEINFYPV